MFGTGCVSPLIRLMEYPLLIVACSQTIYVFNRRYLDIDLDRVLQELHVIPQFNPPIDGECAGDKSISPLTPPRRGDRRDFALQTFQARCNVPADCEHS